MKKQKLFAAALSLSFALGAISPVFADSDELWTIDELVEENNRRAEEMRKLIEEDDYENSNKPSEKSNPPKKEDQASSGQVVDDGPCSEKDGSLIEKGGPSIEKGGLSEIEELPKSEANNNVSKKAEPDESIKELKEARDTARQLVATGKLLIKYYPNTIKKVRPQLEKLIRQAEALLYEADRLLAEYY